MFGCVFVAHFSMILNGSPKGLFSASKRLRQGDPLLTDSLCQIIINAKSKAPLKDAEWVPTKLMSHFQFVEDTLILGRRGKNVVILESLHNVWFEVN